MQIHISPRNIPMTAVIHGYVAEKIGHLEHLNGRLLATHLGLPGPDIHAESNAPDLFSAIDLVTDKLARQLRKYKTRLLKRRVARARKLKLAR